ncbi:MAG: hypothetical protein GY725_23665 [bacterium]|nr:hypothetical protein [bacterium]
MRGCRRIDHYYLRNCRAAIDDFRAERDIATPMQKIDDCSVFWRRET